MSVNVRIPAPLRKVTGGESEIQGEGSTVAELIDNLEASHPGIKEKLVNENGKLHPFINLYINDEDVRYLEELDSAISDGDKISIVPAIAGG